MVDNKNLLDSILQAPGSLASKAFQGVANTARDRDEDNIRGNVSRYVIDKLENNVENLEKLDKPYRQGVARPLSTFLQTVKDVGKDDLTPRQTWDRAWERSGNATVGQAAIGAVARFVPFKQGADKVDWSKQSSVTDYFEKDNTAAERVSGAIDGTVMFFLDPLVFLGKGAKLARLSALGVRGTAIKSPITFGKNNLSKLIDDLDKAEAGENNSAAIVIDSIEKNAGNFVKLEALPIVANSQNPTAVARAFSEALETGGRKQLIDVIRVGLGDNAALTRIQAQDSVLTETLTELRGQVSSINKQMSRAAPKKGINDRPTLTPRQLKNLEASKEKLIAARDKAQVKLDSVRTAATPEIEGGIVGKVGTELAWSSRKHIEYMRAKAGEINGRGLFTDYSAEIDLVTAKAMHKASAEDLAKMANNASPGYVSETSFRVLRTVGYFGRGYKTREVPAGSVTIAGEIGDFANREFRARIIAGAKEAGLSAKQQADYYNKFSALTTDSARFQYLEKFEKDTLISTIKRNFDTSDLNESQIKKLSEVIEKIAQDTLASKSAQMRQIIDEQNYVYIDPKSGKELIFKELQQSVETMAARLAAQAGKPLDDTYRKQAKELIKGTPLTRTQVPNVHFGVDFGLIANVLRDEKVLIPGLIKVIKDQPDVTSKEINELLDKAKATKELNSVSGFKEMGSKSWHNLIVPGYEGIQNYFWKPAVLLSLRYTSRNALDGWARVLASFSDMATHHGYSLMTLTGIRNFDPSIITKPVQVRSGLRKLDQRIKAQGLFGTGGAKSREAAALAEKLENEAVIGRSFGIEKTDSPETIAKKITKRYEDEGEHFMKESEDVLAASLQMANHEFAFFASYKGTPTNTAVAREIAKLGKTIFKIGPSKKVSAPMLNAMSKADFELAYKIAINSDPKIINSTLEAVTKRAQEASKTLDDLTKGKNLDRTPKLKLKVERLREILELIEDNSNVAKMAFDSDNRIRIMSDYNEALSVSRSPAEKIVPYSEKDVSIGYGATIAAPYARTMRRETTSSANSTSRAVLGARRNTLAHFFSGGKSERIVEPTENIWSSAHAEYMNNIIYGDDAAKFIIDMSVRPRSLKDPVVAAKVKRMKASGKSKTQIDNYMKSKYSDSEIKTALLAWIKSPASDTWRKEKLVDLGEYRETLKDAQWSDFTRTIFDETHRYLPMKGPSGEDMSFLREALVEGVFDDTPLCTYSCWIPKISCC
jgi:hypothetical protein